MKEHFINTISGKIFIKESGEGEPFLLIHGVLSSSDSFLPLLKSPPENVRMIALDLPGHGNSTPSKQFTPDWQLYSDLIYELAQKLNISNGFNLLGHSMGGGIAAYFAASNPKMIKKLILIDSLTGIFKLPLKGQIVQIPLIGDFIFKFLYNEKMFLNYFKTDVFYDASKINESHVKTFYKKFNKNRELTLKAIRNTANQQIIADKISDIQSPTLIIWGEHDTLIPPHVSKSTAATIKNSTLKTVKNSGHSPIEESPDLTIPLIFKFL